MAASLALLSLSLLVDCSPASSPATSNLAAPAAPLVPAQAAATPAAPQATTPAFDHSELDALLKKYGSGDRIDYAALKADRAGLDAYLDRVAKLPDSAVAKWPRAEQMAFWINAYNAWTLRTIVDHYPIQGSSFSRFPKSSIRQLDDPWKTNHTVAGVQRSLDDLEHKILRAEFKDPRIHAAVNCASVGCPPIRLEAFTAARLDEQLDDQMRKFVADPLRNRIDPAKKERKIAGRVRPPAQ